MVSEKLNRKNLVMVDCYMSLNVPYAIELASRCIKDDIDINWFEGACLLPFFPLFPSSPRTTELTEFPSFAIQSACIPTTLTVTDSSRPRFRPSSGRLASMSTQSTASESSSRTEASTFCNPTSCGTCSLALFSFRPSISSVRACVLIWFSRLVSAFRLGGLTELLKVSAMAAAYDIPVVPHGSGPYSYHVRPLLFPHLPFASLISYLNR
jgi:hypothetical protein